MRMNSSTSAPCPEDPTTGCSASVDCGRRGAGAGDYLGVQSAGSAHEQLDTSMIEVESTMPSVNDEKALVLYKQVNVRVFSVSSDVMSGIMNQYLWPLTSVNADGAQRPPVNNCLAMVPWQAPFHAPVDMPPEEELMDAEVTEASSMEIEEVNSREAVNTGDSFQQWQQHCMTVQLPPNRSTPIMWSRV